MTRAQAIYLSSRTIDPWSLQWAEAADFGVTDCGLTEAALLPTGSVLVANGTVRSTEEREPEADQ